MGSFTNNEMVLIYVYLTSCLSASLLQGKDWEFTTTTATTTTTWTAESNQLESDLFKEKCEQHPVQFHVGKRGKVIREGSNSVIIRVKQPIPADSNYTSLVIFDRQACGIDFLRKIYNHESSGVG